MLDSADQGTAVGLTTFDQINEPINVVVVAETTGAMNDVIEDIKKGVRALADALDPKAKPKMALLGYASTTKRLAELGQPADVESAANTMAIDTEGVEFNMLDAVRTGIDLLNAAPKGQRKLIVLFSDGLDVNMDRKAFLAIGRRAQDAGIIIDTIGYAPFEASKLKNLNEISRQSNGTERICKAASDVDSAFVSVGDEIRKQYVATFEIALKGGDGKDHTFQTIVDSNGRTAYSNTINDKLREATHPIVKKGQGGSHLWLWILLGIGGLVLILFFAWLIFREKDEEMGEEEEAPQAVAAPAAAPAGPQKTMALDLGAGGKAPMVGWIVATSGKHTNQTFKFKPVRTLIGTGGDCDIVIEDQFMSSHHCEVRIEPNGSFKMIDLGSTNGIVVNDKKVREHELVDNDQFRLGRTEFKFKSIG
jgi:hypothetical protein